MHIDRRQFVAAFGSTLAAAGSASWLPAQTGAGKPYGSGHFGEWIEDEFGLPAFRYICDQIHDPKAVTAVSPGILSPTDHVHQVGNDRLIAIVSNYGHVQVRQDEGAPKFLNAYSPERNQFGGGIGYLTDGMETLSTFYTGSAHTFDRIFGVGYFRKKVASANYSIDQAIVAPFGDDPIPCCSLRLPSPTTVPHARTCAGSSIGDATPINSPSALSSNSSAAEAARWSSGASSPTVSRTTFAY
jgi:hypothetical protein